MIMKYILFVSILFIELHGCADPKRNIAATATTTDTLVVTTPMEAEKLLQFTPEFTARFALEDWKELMDFKRDFENLKRLNPKGLSLFLRGLERQCRRVLGGEFPEPFDQNPIKSRLKVVLTEVMQAQYFAENKQNAALEESLKKMYAAYTIFMERIISTGEAELLTAEKEK